MYTKSWALDERKLGELKTVVIKVWTSPTSINGNKIYYAPDQIVRKVSVFGLTFTDTDSQQPNKAILKNQLSIHAGCVA